MRSRVALATLLSVVRTTMDCLIFKRSFEYEIQYNTASVVARAAMIPPEENAREL
jgi:hypothetical protein